MGEPGRTKREIPPHIIVDAGTISEQCTSLSAEQPLAVAVARLGAVKVESGSLSVWLQLRGTAQIKATEGRFILRRGDWVVFDSESRQELQTLRDGLTVGLLLPRAFPLPEGGLIPGAGRIGIIDIRIALNLWRRGMPRQEANIAADLRPLLLHLQHLQASLRELVSRCPGRKDVRKRQVLARMQRVRMCMEGNTHRAVRLAELAEMSRFSEWWVSKTYRTIYGETVQQASLRLRMQRARDLLENSSLSISELGEACGFNDPCSFARLFKRRHGQTASKWRARSQSRGQICPGQPPDLSPALGQDGT